MEKEKLNYMEGLVLYKEEDKMKLCIEKIVKDFRIEGFYDDDIYEYMKKRVMDVMLKDEFDKWKEIKKLMKD
jgi:hypothetical protein